MCPKAWILWRTQGLKLPPDSFIKNPIIGCYRNKYYKDRVRGGYCKSMILLIKYLRERDFL